MKRKLGCHSSSFFASSMAPLYNGGRLFLSAITIIIVALLVFLPSPSSLFSFNVNSNDFVAFASPSSFSQSSPSQSQSQENADPATDIFDLPAGYIIEP